ncbi:MAG: GNAT family N-acetyltransferase [Candidatus Omnitrophica bacterium]|nr:GNAT family N-acetyltransferase [Candidatus Omnitrophota bacterium]
MITTLGTSISIRDTKEVDIDSILRLYGHSVTGEELKWALLYPLNGLASRSFAAVAPDGRVVGHAAGVVSRYRHKGSDITGIHPIFWIVDPAYRGKGIGTELMRKALSLGDFSFIIGGAEGSHAMYRLFGLDFKFDIYPHTKILDPLRYFRVTDGGLPKKIAKALYLMAGRAKRSARNTHGQGVELEPYNEDAVIQGRASGTVFLNSQNARHVKWLLSCPLLASNAFVIRHEKKAIGLAVCYVGDKSGIPTGRLVHMSHLGDDIGVWHAALSGIEAFFKEKGCAVISTLASHPVNIAALKEMGYVAAKKGRPFFLSDAGKRLSDVANGSWHLTFFEGDMAYRGV